MPQFIFLPKNVGVFHGRNVFVVTQYAREDLGSFTSPAEE